jgi:FO synthase
LRYRAARDGLAGLGHDTTLSYLAEMAALVLKETGLLPHLNPGVMSREETERLRTVSVSQGIMLESAAERLSLRGGPHFGSPDKAPARRLAAIARAGEAAVPFTSGILIGIGETRAERIESLLALRALHDRYGASAGDHHSEFPGQAWHPHGAGAEPDLDDHLWTIAVARLIFGPEMNIQAPPNLNPGALAEMIAGRDPTIGAASRRSPRITSTPRGRWPALDGLG